jgi:hypothetical protein
MNSPERSALTPIQRRNLARAYKIGAWIAVVLGIAALSSAILLPVTIALCLVSYFMFMKARKYTAPLADDVLAQDNRPPVLYLRSFNDEEQDHRVRSFLQGTVDGDRGIAQSTPAWGVREQDALAPILSEVGPYIAIGKPGEPLPELGAARAYVSDEAWQSQIMQWLSRARLVIVRAGATNGLQWEIAQIVRYLRPIQLLILLPSRIEDYQSFRSWANGVFPIALPESPTERLMTFDPNWRPVMLSSQRSIKRSLAPYLAQNGIRLRMPYWEEIVETNGYPNMFRSRRS